MSHLSQQERELHTMRFLSLDSDGNGYLDMMELGEMFLSLGYNISYSELKDQFQKIDANGDGRITLDEFLAVIPKDIPEEEKKLDFLKKRFRAMDTDGDGFVTAHDYYLDMKGRGYEITMDDAIEYVKKVGTSGNGKIDLNDYLAFNK